MRLAALEIPAQPEFVSVARLVVSSVAGDRYELSDDQLESLKLAVSEACVLAIQGRTENAGSHVAIDCDGDDGHIAITVGCEGSDIDHGSSPVTSADASDGHDFNEEFGLPFIGSLVDELNVEERPQGNRLRLTVFSTLAEEL